MLELIEDTLFMVYMIGVLVGLFIIEISKIFWGIICSIKRSIRNFLEKRKKGGVSIEYEDV